MATKELIATVTVGAGGAASIDFTSIPGTYTDLMVQFSGRPSSNDATAYIEFNGSSGGYTSRNLLGFGGASLVISQTQTRLNIGTLKNDTANTFGSVTTYIPNYAGSTNKSVSTDQSSEANISSQYNFIYAGLWSNTAAITSLSIKIDAGNFVQYSTATLYGVKSGQSGTTTVS
jgi:hypothetical protein